MTVHIWSEYFYSKTARVLLDNFCTLTKSLRNMHGEIMLQRTIFILLKMPSLNKWRILIRADFSHYKSRRQKSALLTFCAESRWVMNCVREDPFVCSQGSRKQNCPRQRPHRWNLMNTQAHVVRMWLCSGWLARWHTHTYTTSERGWIRARARACSISHVNDVFTRGDCRLSDLFSQHGTFS